MVTVHINFHDLPLVSMATERTLPVDKIKRLTLSETYKIFSDPEVTKQLFPGRYFVVGYGSWLPITTNERNLRHVAIRTDIQ